MGRTMEWAASANHMGGVPRRVVIGAVGAFVKAVSFILNTTTVHNAETLLRLVRHRPHGIPLLTVSNHVSTSLSTASSAVSALFWNMWPVAFPNCFASACPNSSSGFSFEAASWLDDPVMWGFKGFPTMNANLERWTLTAEDICFKNKVLSYVFRLGKCIPIARGGGIYQEHMNEALDRLSEGEWLHTFPEGKVYQDYGPIRRLKWGTASLIVRAPVTPIILPIYHQGLQEVMPENYLFGRRPLIPLCNKKIKIVVGEPIEFDLPKLTEMVVSTSKNKDSFSSCFGWPTCRGLNEVAQKHLYSTISERLRTVLENLRNFAKK